MKSYGTKWDDLADLYGIKTGQELQAGFIVTGCIFMSLLLILFSL